MKASLFYVSLNILVCLILLGDAFEFTPNVKNVSINEINSKLTRAKRTTYYNYFIYTSDNCKYEIPRNIYEDLKVSDSVSISSSLIFKMPLKLSYRKDDKVFVYDIGQLQTKKSEKYGLIISIALSFLALLFLLTMPNKYYNIYKLFIIFPIVITIVVFLFIVIEVLSV